MEYWIDQILKKKKMRFSHIFCLLPTETLVLFQFSDLKINWYYYLCTY